MLQLENHVRRVRRPPRLRRHEHFDVFAAAENIDTTSTTVFALPPSTTLRECQGDDTMGLSPLLSDGEVNSRENAPTKVWWYNNTILHV